MCGEVFSSNPKFTPEFKARVDQPHPLARPGRWSVVFAEPGSKPTDHETAFFDDPAAAARPGRSSKDGFATEAEARVAIAYQERGGHATPWYYLVVPPAETFGDHDASRLDRDQLVRLGNAILNNDAATYEKLRQEYADVTRAPKAPPAPPKPTRQEYVLAAHTTRAAAADSIVAFLLDETGGEGNSGSYVDLDDEPGGEDAKFELDNLRFFTIGRDVIPNDAVSDADDHYGSVDLLRDLVRAYQNAAD